MPRKLSETYGAIHQWVRLNWGQPAICEKCGVGKGKRFEWARKPGTLTRFRSDWLRLCSVCHGQMDKVGLPSWNKGRKGLQKNHNLSGLIGGGWNKGNRKREMRDCGNKGCPEKFYPPKESSRFCSKSCAMVGNKRAKLIPSSEGAR